MAPHSHRVASRESRRVVSELRDALLKADALASSVRRYKKGEVLLREGEANDSILIILEGKVALSKNYGTNNPLPVGTLEPGDFVGLLSFFSTESVFTTVVARTSLAVLVLTRQEFEKLSDTNPELSELLDVLIVGDLAQRYRRIVTLHLEVAALTNEVESERNQLQRALEELRETRNRLIHQEKMAILGQLVAGVAHEINNPTSAVLRSVEHLTESLPVLFAQADDASVRSAGARMLSYGLVREIAGTDEQLARMDALAEQYPALLRTTIRSLAQLSTEPLASLAPELADAHSPAGMKRIELLLKFFDAGSSLRSLLVSGERIGSIVRSLRAYSREGRGDYEQVDVRKGIEDTLLIVGNRLKNITVALHMTEVPPVFGLGGELNQVWTNVILNACDAMHDQGSLSIGLAREGDTGIRVTIADSGPGIPADVLPRIFEPNFTTKTASGSFGLGLGLAISNEIIQKHGGTIQISNASVGGAVCTVVLPVERRG